jgi:hypothetical protein
LESPAAERKPNSTFEAFLPVAESSVAIRVRSYDRKLDSQALQTAIPVNQGGLAIAMSTRMDAVFAFKALSYGFVGLLAIGVLALSLISLRRDIRSGRPLTGLVRFALVIGVFCVLMTLYTAYVRFKRATTARLDRIALTIQR